MIRRSLTTNRSPVLSELLAASSLVVLLAGCGRASAPASTLPGSPPQIVPWLPRPAAHLYAQPPPPSPPILVPAGTPPCNAGHLDAVGTFAGVATGHADHLIIVRNRGTSACSLEGYADVSLVDVSGGLLAQAVGVANRGTFFADGPVVPVLLEPGTAPLTAGATAPQQGDRGQAWMNVEWYDCRHTQAAQAFLDLPDGGGRISAPFLFQAPYSPVCDVPGHGGDARVSRGPLSPSGLEWPPRPALIAVAVRINAPASARRGSTLVYTVAVLNQSQMEYRLDPCPDYVEILGAKQAVATYQLNCSPVGALRPGTEATFEMHFAVPATLSPTTAQLSWSLSDGRLARPTATTTVTIL